MTKKLVIPSKESRKIAKLEAEKEELLLATIELANTLAAQNIQLQEQAEALVELANTLAEVINNG